MYMHVQRNKNVKRKCQDEVLRNITHLSQNRTKREKLETEKSTDP